MSDPIKKDDDKLDDLLIKQYPTYESFANSLPKSDDAIENDDEKMDDLLCLQDSASDGEIQYGSIEEKYEEELLTDDIARQIRRDYGQDDIIWEVDSGEDDDIEF